MTAEQFTSRLRAHRASEASRLWRRAAVAAVVRFAPDPRVLLIERAVREGDRWSGHVAFPGGLEGKEDADLMATALRETREEVGVHLDRDAQLLGRLEPVRAIARGKVLPMTITPFVFQVTDEPAVVANAEVAGWFWLPLDPAASGALDDRYAYPLGPVKVRLPCWRYEGHTVWGLTYRMLQGLLAVVAA